MIDKNIHGQIMQLARIEEVVAEYLALTPNGTNLIGQCPFHNDFSRSLLVQPLQNIFTCTQCGKTGNAIHFLMEIEQLTYQSAMRLLAQKNNIPVPKPTLTELSEREQLFALNQFVAEFFVTSLTQSDEGRTIGFSYFKERGFSDHTIAKFKLGYSLNQWDAMALAALQAGFTPSQMEHIGVAHVREDNRMTDRYRGRVMFPITSISGKVVAFGGRVLRTDDKTAKYINSADSDIYHKSNELYGIELAKKAIVEQNRCFLVEGYTDVISMHQAGIENVVAASGTALTKEQVRLISRFTNQVTVLFDGDAAGIRASFKGIDLLLERNMFIKVLLLPDGDDPDSFVRKHIKEEFANYVQENSVSFIRFKAQFLANQAGDDPMIRAEVIQDIARSIALVPAKKERLEYIRECSNVLEIPEDVLVRSIDKIRLSAKTEAKTNRPATNSLVEIKMDRPFENESRNLIQALIRHGNKTLYIDAESNAAISVGHYILYELEHDQITLFNPLYNTILDEYRAHWQEADFVSEKYFLYHHDNTISRLAIELIADKYPLSKIHFHQTVSENVKGREIAIPSDEERLTELIPKLIFELKNSLLKSEIKKILVEIKIASKAKNKALEQELLVQLMALDKVLKELSNSLGVVLPIL